MERAEVRQARERGDTRTPFERFVEWANHRVSDAPFFFVIVVVIVVWAASYPLFPDAKSWQVAIHTVGSVVSLLLLVLLENAGRRSQEAAQEKLNVLAEAFSALMESRGRDDPALLEAAEKLRDAVGLEERH